MERSHMEDSPQQPDPERLKWLEALTLYSGKHDEDDAERCVMEAVAYVAGEPHSDHPKCACAVITAR